MKLNKRSEAGRARARTAEDVLDAAARAFARSGFQHATMRDIADEAGCTAPALYTYFESKGAILQGLIQRLVGELTALFEEPVPTGLTFAQRLELLVQRQLALVETRRGDFLLCFSPSALTVLAASPPSAGPSDPFELFMARLVAWVRDAADRELLSRTTPEELAHLLIGLEYAYFLAWMRGGGRGRPADSAHAVVDRLLYGALGAR